MKGYIYKLISKKNGDNRFYIGSSNDMNIRIRNHKNDPSKNVKSWIKEVGWENITYVNNIYNQFFKRFKIEYIIIII